MTRPPRDPQGRVITGRMWFDIIYVGVIMAIGTLLVMDWALPGGLLSGGGDTPATSSGQRTRYAQTMAFTTLVFFQLFNVFNARFDDRSAFHKLGRNRWLWLLLRATPQRARMTPLLSSSKESQGNPW